MQAFLFLLALLVPLLFTARTLEASALKIVLTQGGAAGLALLLLGGWARGWLAVPSRWLLWPLGLYFTANLTSFALACTTYGERLAGMHELWRLGCLLTVAVAVATVVNTPTARLRLAWIVAVATSVVTGYAMLQRFGLDSVTWSQSSQERVFSTIGNPNMMAGYLVAVIPILVFLLVSEAGQAPMDKRFWSGVWGATFCKRFAPRLGVGLVIVLAVAAIAFSKSKGGLLGLGAELLALVFLCRQSICDAIRRRPALTGLTVPLAALLLLLAAWPMLDRFGDVKLLGKREVSTSNVRLVIWQGTRHMFAAHPWVGVGPGGFNAHFPQYRNPDYSAYGVTHNTIHAHSEPLQILAETGMLGGAAFLLLSGAVFGQGYRVWRETGGRGEADGKITAHQTPSASPPICAIRTPLNPDRLFLGAVLCGLFGLLAQASVCVIARWPTCGLHLWIWIGLVGAYLPVSPRSAATVQRVNQRLFRPVLALVFLPVALLLGWGVKRLTWDVYRSELLTMTGSRMNHQARWPEALRALEGAVALNPANVRAVYYQAYAHFQRADYAQALAVYRQVCRLNPDYCQLHFDFAACHLNRQEWEEAAREYARQRQIGGLPDDFQADALLALLKSQVSDREKYRRALETLLEINPQDKITRNQLGNLLFHQNEFRSARRQYQQILADDPAFVPALNNLAGTWFATGDYRQAREITARITTLSPENSVAWRNLGKACLMLNDQSAAHAALHQAQTLDPANPETQELLREIAKSSLPLTVK